MFIGICNYITVQSQLVPTQDKQTTRRRQNFSLGDCGCFKDPKLSNSFSLKSIIQIGNSKINWLQNTHSHFIHLQLTEWTWKETVLACLEALSEHLLANTKENSKNSKPR
jgi:hypothetical protein